jgi:hypothetical protein
MREILAAATVGLCLIYAGRAFADAELKFANPSGSPVLTIHGSINKKDADYVATHEVELGKPPLLVILNSEGGSTAAALAIGRIIRKNEATVMVPESGECFSSCAFLFIAGVNRMNFGVIGLHRPYYGDAPLSRQQIEEQMPRELEEVKLYVRSMGISDAFFDEMIKTAPEHMRRYRGSAIFALVPQSDIISDEIEVAHAARLRGISMRELRIRQKEAEKCTRLYDDAAMLRRVICADAILWGLSESVHAQRQAKAEQICKYSVTDQAAIDAAGLVGRDLPLVLKHEECVKNVMLGRQ